MKNKIQNILFFIIGVIFMGIAIISLIYLYAYKLDTTIYLDTAIYLFELYIFINMFLSVNFLIPGLNLFLNNKIEKIFSIKRIFYVAIILTVFLLILMNIIFPPKLFWL